MAGLVFGRTFRLKILRRLTACLVLSQDATDAGREGRTETPTG